MHTRLWFLVSLVGLFSSCKKTDRSVFSNAGSQSDNPSSWNAQLSGGAFQVSSEEYRENFESKFGLLHLKSETTPFTGRILTVSTGEKGEYVSSDESWKDGRKNGKCSKWFSNGVKMYERNYKSGKWHGTVTRWWPNGQKMYVRAYSYGARHGTEATWRSDGTPLTLPGDGFPLPASPSNASPLNDDASPTCSEEIGGDSDFSAGQIADDSLQTESSDSLTSENNLEIMDTNIAEDLPVVDFSPPSSDSDQDQTFDAFPALADGLESPESVEMEDQPDEPLLPVMEEGEVGVGLPPVSTNETVVLPEDNLPSFPADEPMDDLPVLPDDGAVALPPLPGGNDDFGDLPPLPPLP